MEQFIYTNEGKVLLREANEKDVSKLPELYEGLPKNEYWRTEELAKIHYDLVERNNGTTYVAVLGEEVIGHGEVVLPNSKDEPAFLIKVQIKDDLRRRKFGTEIVRYSMIMTKKKGYIGYAVWPDFDKSKGLYKKLGLKEEKNNQELEFQIKDDSPERTAEIIEEINSLEEFKEWEMVAGCSFIVDFLWMRSFELAKNNLLDYREPIIQKVEVEGGKGVIFFDNRNLYVSVPEDKQEDVELITSLLKYGSQIAKDENAGKLMTHIDEDLWQEIESEMDEYWEIELSQPRLEMEMEFDD